MTAPRAQSCTTLDRLTDTQLQDTIDMAEALCGAEQNDTAVSFSSMLAAFVALVRGRRAGASDPCGLDQPGHEDHADECLSSVLLPELWDRQKARQPRIDREAREAAIALGVYRDNGVRDGHD
jgi:hypothetical protein